MHRVWSWHAVCVCVRTHTHTTHTHQPPVKNREALPSPNESLTLETNANRRPAGKTPLTPLLHTHAIVFIYILILALFLKSRTDFSLNYQKKQLRAGPAFPSVWLQLCLLPWLCTQPTVTFRILVDNAIKASLQNCNIGSLSSSCLSFFPSLCRKWNQAT